MKLSLFFLACYFLATTFGQNIFYWPYAPYGGAQYAASSNGRSGGRFWPRFHQHYRPEPSFEDDFDGENDEVYGRGNYQFRAEGSNSKRPFNKYNQKNYVDERQFRSSSVTPVISVVTTFGATTTVTVTSFSSCIPKNQFNTPAAANGALSTTACRRKRDALEVLERIAPTSNIGQIETTPLTKEQKVLSRIQRDVEPSQEYEPRFGFNALNSALPGLSLLFGISPTPTIVTTLTLPTTFAFSTTVVPKTVSLLAAAPAPGGAIATAINCLPAGFGVC